MRASAVVEVGGGKPPVESGRGVVAPLEGGQTGLDCARGQRLRSQPPRCPVVIVVRLVSATRRTTELSAPRSRRRARDDGRATAGPRRQARDALPGGSPSSPHGLPVATTELGWPS